MKTVSIGGHAPTMLTPLEQKSAFCDEVNPKEGGRSVAQPQAMNPFFERVSATASPKW